MIKVYIKMVSYIQLSLQVKIIIIQICIERFLMYHNYWSDGYYYHRVQTGTFRDL